MSQQIWNKVDKANYHFQKKDIYQKKHFPSDYQILSLDVNSFSKNLKQQSKSQNQIIELPNADGTLSKFNVKETSNFEEGLQAKFPNIKSYSAQGIDDPTAIAKISIGTDGFHAVVFSGNKGTLYMDPYSKDNQDLIVYQKSSLSKVDDDFKCEIESSVEKEVTISDFTNNADDGKLRTYRLALACTGEYADFHLGEEQQNIDDDASDSVKKEAILSAMNTSITRINGVFEKDLAIKLVIVDDNDKIIFLDADLDGMSDADPNTLINQVQTICDAQIGDANYDVGHVFSTSGGQLSGLAGLGVVCVTGQKARGVTGLGSPVGDPYDIDLVAHELGHQFGATHTQNNDCNRTSSTAVEPGSGSTIMGYAGICSPNVEEGNLDGNSDDYFHAVSIAQIWSVIESSGSCAVLTDTNNTAPVANAGSDYIIPKSTPFKLSGIATDVDGLSSLTYNWEQLDNEVGAMPPESTNSVGPMFRSLPSKTSPERYMPDLATVIAGNISSTWEVLPSVERDLSFSFLVRDNNAGGGSTARDDMIVSVTDAIPFTVSTPSSAVTWDVGSVQTINWVKGSTDIAPINCATVNIKLSIDGGLTFPITIKSNTPNDGTEEIVIPNNATSSARIMIEAADNIFYNVSSTNFTINSTEPTFIMENTTGSQITCNTENETLSYNLNFDFINGFTENVVLSATGQPAGADVTFSPSTINSDGNVTMQISGLNAVTPQIYTINVLGSSSSLNQNIDVELNVTTSNFNTVSLSSPENNSIEVDINTELNWLEDSNVLSYDVQVATDSNFSSIISSGNVTTNSYSLTSLLGDTVYYWRVKPKNDCGEGSFSEVYNFSTLTPSYCLSTFTDELGGTEHITNVTFNDINNDSGNNTINGYEDFTSISTNVKRGDIHQISVTFDTGGYRDQCFVFIDWNQDYVFDNDTEMYDLGEFDTDIATATLDIAIPEDARFGETRMRVFIEYYDNSYVPGGGACDVDHVSEWGETEDYTIVIDNTASVDDYGFDGFNLYPNPTEGEFTLSLKAVNADEVSVQLFDVNGRLIDEKNYYNTLTDFSERISFNKASAGLYMLKVINGEKQVVKKLIIR
ncbi:reprolysin-like metallopeptidase [Polaribacter sargassicola]|uniref:reprolysin-like metallopeptidase n=1 Tax=Polaribacter sargassicola TaxID=2836891 RepID=UPI001F248921|nr:zinc-dependent metalloprotease family protein [Polaribacter sp. DS7-9]